MSTYRAITRHPVKGTWHDATWHDDYFAPHYYGVEFEGDKKIYPADFVRERELETFMVSDVIHAAMSHFGNDKEQVIEFLKEVDKAYKEHRKLALGS